MAVLAGVYGKAKPEYEGCVVDLYEHNGYHDSYWYAICWDREKKELVEVEYDTTAAAGGGWAEIDATEDVVREMYRFRKKSAKELFDTYGNEAQAKKVSTGDNVIVVRGRKIPQGTKGKVFWLGSKYNQYSRKFDDRVGIEKPDGTRVFLNKEYVIPVDWRDRLLHGSKRKQFIRRDAFRAMPTYCQVVLKEMWA